MRGGGGRGEMGLGAMVGTCDMSVDTGERERARARARKRDCNSFLILGCSSYRCVPLVSACVCFARAFLHILFPERTLILRTSLVPLSLFLSLSPSLLCLSLSRARSLSLMRVHTSRVRCHFWSFARRTACVCVDVYVCVCVRARVWPVRRRVS